MDFSAKLYYPQPDEKYGDVIIWCTVREAIEYQRDTAAKVKPGFVYGSDKDALLDFMNVNWASYNLNSWKPARLFHLKDKL